MPEPAREILKAIGRSLTLSLLPAFSARNREALSALGGRLVN